LEEEMTETFRIAEQIKAVQSDWISRRWVSHPASTGAEKFTVVEATIAPGQGHGFHKHPDQEEVVYILAGTVEQWVDREKRVLVAGDAAFLSAGAVHASFNVGEGEARLMAIFGPCVGEGFTTIEVGDQAPWKNLRA
jgi:quercetin dioxygenase-like cupin family protein